MKRTMLMIVLMLVLTTSFAAAQEVEIPVIFDRSWMNEPVPMTDPRYIEIDKIKTADFQKSEIALSPDGHLIAFLSGGRYIWIVPAEGGEPRLVYEIPEEQLLYYAPEDYLGYYQMFYGHIRMITFSPDGEEITFCRAYYDPLKGSDYYFAEKTAASSGIRNLILTIESANIATGEVHTVIEEGTCPSWSADGRYLAYVHNDHMVYLDPSQAKYDGVPSIYDTVTGETRHLFDVNSTVSYSDPDPFKAQRTGKVYWGGRADCRQFGDDLQSANRQ